ncbi:hypothetical protein RIF29_16411 [Crotalaria pallida]|uniref:Uncharacterized protein n=1 Tax=Crotalaria pallida TaxID=3830 RepID=A0AAN9FGJ3_CROPI
MFPFSLSSFRLSFPSLSLSGFLFSLSDKFDLRFSHKFDLWHCVSSRLASSEEFMNHATTKKTEVDLYVEHVEVSQPGTIKVVEGSQSSVKGKEIIQVIDLEGTCDVQKEGFVEGSDAIKGKEVCDEVCATREELNSVGEKGLVTRHDEVVGVNEECYSDSDNDSVKYVAFNDIEEERDLGLDDLFDVEIRNEGVVEASGTNHPEGPTEAAANNVIEGPTDAVATNVTEGPTNAAATNAPNVVEGPIEAAATNTAAMGEESQLQDTEQCGQEAGAGAAVPEPGVGVVVPEAVAAVVPEPGAAGGPEAVVDAVGPELARSSKKRATSADKASGSAKLR